MTGFLNFLSDALKWVFDNVLSPILESFLQFVFNQLVDIIYKAVAWLLYFIWTTLLKCVSFLSTLFDYFAGTEKGMVTYEGSKTTLLEAIFSMSFVMKMFAAFLLLGVSLTFIFTIINTIKSMSDMTLEDKNPISKVIKNAIKSMVMFAFLPIFCIFLLRLSGVVMNTIEQSSKVAQQVSTGNDASSSPSIDRLIWLNCSLHAAVSDNQNTKEASTASTSNIRYKYVWASENDLADYGYSAVKDESDFEERFSFEQFDYFQGIVAAIIVIYVLLTCCFTFIARIFEVLILFIVGPVFAATIAHDGGEMFKTWKDMFIAKFIGSYSVVFGMKLYLILIPEVCSGKFTFSSTDIPYSTGMFSFNALIQLVLIIGGAFAVYSSQSMVLRILSIEAAESVNQSMGAAGMVADYGLSFGKVVKSGTMGVVGGATSAVFGSLLGTNKGKDGEGSDDKEDIDSGSSDSGSSSSDSGSSSSGAYRGGAPGQ